jgi:hydroxypyruvate isomerase
MPKFSANLSFLYQEYEFLDRLAAAAKDGFKGVEYMAPYEFRPETIRERLDDNGLQQVLFNLPAGDWANGERGIACHPDRVAEFRAGVVTAMEYAYWLGCPQINCLAGIKPPHVSAEFAWQTLIANLEFAAAALNDAGLTLLLEPINYFDMPGFFINTSAQAMQALGEVTAANLKLQYDVYHMQRMEDELSATLARLMPNIGHIQIADNPGRHEPGTGEINYRHIFRHIDFLGYNGWIGCEYQPLNGTSAGLGWMKELH